MRMHVEKVKVLIFGHDHIFIPSWLETALTVHFPKCTMRCIVQVEVNLDMAVRRNNLKV